MLPTFIIVGAPRSGTTSLYNYCAQHPDVFMSPIKEVNYFSSNNHGLTEEDYRQLFEPGREKLAVGEASPSYLRREDAPRRISSLIPECQIIVILRDPVSRFLSDFKYSRRFGFHPNPLESYLPVRTGDEIAVPKHFEIGTMREKGFYYRQIRQYREVIDEDKIHIFIYDDLIEDTSKLVGTLFGLLGISQEFTPNIKKKHNKSTESRWSWLARSVRGGKVEYTVRRLFSRVTADRVLSGIKNSNSRPSSFVPSETAVRQVRQWYKDEVQQLEEMINRSLDNWLASPVAYIEQ